jgi:galactokinase
VKQALESVLGTFREIFGGEPDLVASAPGRVNLIGEHTDYMGGLVMPVAIDRQILFAIRSAPGEFVTGYSTDFGERVRFRVGEFNPAHPSHWLRYVLGVLQELERIGIKPGGFEFCVAGNVPQGSGLSSSAALEVAVARAVLDLVQHPLPKQEIALLCQRAENGFVGMQCGIMDQYISAMGIADHALKIDCADLGYEAVAAAVPGHTWLVIDSGKKRGLVDSEYNLRRTQCQAGLEWLQSRLPHLRQAHGLRALSPEELRAVSVGMDPILLRRIRHVVGENARVAKACAALRSGDLAALGENLAASHRSLRDDYEVSCPELDALVDILQRTPGTVGARLTGAGFGGCVIALVGDEFLEAAVAAVRREYPARFPTSRPVSAWPIRLADGAKGIYSSAASLRLNRGT